MFGSGDRYVRYYFVKANTDGTYRVIFNSYNSIIIEIKRIYYRQEFIIDFFYLD